MNKIEKSKYTGYLWYSNKTKPEVFYNTDLEITIQDNENPFIVEGWLCDGGKSIYIKYVDGRHIIKYFDLNELRTNALSVEKKYMPSFKDFEEMCFEQFWHPEKDDNCEAMSVLTPKEFVFVDFKR